MFKSCRICSKVVVYVQKCAVRVGFLAFKRYIVAPLTKCQCALLNIILLVYLINQCPMVRQYRIDHFNGMEILICECYDKHVFTEKESEAVAAWCQDNPGAKYQDFRDRLSEFLEDPSNYDEQFRLTSAFYGLVEPIPVFDFVPSIVLRGAVLANRVSSLQVDYQPGVSINTLEYEVSKFLRFTSGAHWRNAISHQVEQYGTLFGSSDN